MNGKDRLTRRGFLELSSGAIATAGLLPGVNAARVAPRPGETVDTVKRDSAQMTGKIALEWHRDRARPPIFPSALSADAVRLSYHGN